MWNKTFQSFAIVSGFSVATRLLSFLFKIWMSRSLGAEMVGLYQISLSVLLLLFAITAGAPTVLSRKVAEAVAAGDVKRQNALATASVAIGLATAGVLCAVLYACHSKLGIFFTDERCVGIFLIMLPALLTSTLYSSLRSWFWGRKNFLAFSSTELIDEVLKIGFSVLLAGGLVATMTGAKGVALAMLLSDVVSVLVLAVLFFKAGGRIAKPAGAREIVLATLPLSAVRILTSLSTSLTALIIPQRLVAGGMTVALATAEYGRVAGMALPLIMAPITVISALSVVLIPDIAALSSQGNMAAVKSKLRTSLVFASIVAAVFFALYVPLGEQLGLFFFGDAQAGKFVSYSAVLIFPIAFNQVTSPVLNSLGMERHTFISYIIGAICMLPCIFFLPSVIGIYSMAAASGVAFTLSSLLNGIFIAKRLGAVDGLGKSTLLALFALPLAALGFFTNNLLRPFVGNTVSLIVIAVYILFFFFLFVSAFKIVDVRGFFSMINVPHKKRE